MYMYMYLTNKLSLVMHHSTKIPEYVIDVKDIILHTKNIQYIHNCTKISEMP